MFEKLLKHLTNAPVAVALAFLLVGAPAAPVAKMLPSSGVAMATGQDNGPQDYGPGCWFEHMHDTDCDGLADAWDPCPYNPDLGCSVLDSSAGESGRPAAALPPHMTRAQCYEYETAGRDMAAALAAGAAVVAVVSGPIAVVVAAAAGIMYLQSEMGRLRCGFTYF